MQKMSEKEALQDIQFLARRYNDLDQLNYSIKQGSLDMAIQALDEIQQYKEIGTLEECREAVERMKPKNTLNNDMSKKEKVNHPSHYNAPGRKECIVEMLEKFGKEKVITFCELNAYKYHYRHEMKNGQEDLEKAKWYEDFAEKLKGEEHE